MVASSACLYLSKVGAAHVAHEHLIYCSRRHASTLQSRCKVRQSDFSTCKGCPAAAAFLQGPPPFMAMAPRSVLDREDRHPWKAAVRMHSEVSEPRQGFVRPKLAQGVRSHHQAVCALRPRCRHLEENP